MPSHFSTIGFEVGSNDQFVALARQIAGMGQPVPGRGGQYLRWSGSGGEELWLQVDGDGDLVGMNPHFSGKSSLRVAVHGRVQRDKDSVLDGAFEGWAAPPADEPDGGGPDDGDDRGAYPLVFDAPDAATYGELQLPGIAEVQIAAFAHEIAYHDTPEAFVASAVGLASQAFIPAGLFSPEGRPTEPPEAVAIFAGHVRESAERRNGLTGRGYYWALVDSLGGSYDVVIDRGMLPALPAAGGVLSGTFWLSGRLTDYPRRRTTWSGKPVGGAS
jgi:hypothetical protein